MINPVTKEKNQENSALHNGRIAATTLFVPRADIHESKDSIIIKAEIPGADENSVEVTLDKNILTLTASVPLSKHEGYTLSHSEYPIGDYKRAFTLPNEIDRNGIEAVVKNGVLKLTLPKSKDYLPRKILVTGV